MSTHKFEPLPEPEDDRKARFDAAQREEEPLLAEAARQAAKNATTRQARSAKATTVPTAKLTEFGLADAFIAKYGETLRYDHDRGKWYRWTGKIWQLDRTKFTLDMVKRFCAEQTAPLSFKEKRPIERSAVISAVAHIAGNNVNLAVTSDIWDANDYLLGTPDGTVDLHTGLLRQPQIADFITKKTSIVPQAMHAPRWLAFIDEVTNHDPDLQRYIQKICGLILTGSTKEQCIFFIYGPGGNGKSVFINTINAILHDYAVVAPLDMFAVSHQEKHSTDMAMIKGARIVSSSETEEGKSLAEAKIKQITGGDQITARFMRQDNFTFTPKCKLIIIGNHKPILRNVDEALKRRIHVIPFTTKPKQIDNELILKLKEEYPQILAWMIEGCLAWQREGLNKPDCVIEETKQYFENQDIFANWLEDCCKNNSSGFELSSKLYESWKRYAENAGVKAGSTKTFPDLMKRRGYRHERTRSGRVFYGLILAEKE